MLPGALKNSIAPLKHETPFGESLDCWPPVRHIRKMLVLEGCVQPSLAPSINASAARVLDRLGISLIKAPDAGCCGALSYHLNAQQEGLDYMRRNVDAWWPYVRQGGVEAIVMTASGCGVTVKEYGHLLRHDPVYAEKAARISELTRDISEVLEAEAPRLASLFEQFSERKKEISLLFIRPAPCNMACGFAAWWKKF